MRARVRCNDCGWEKTFSDQAGLSGEARAKAAKAGHVGGQSQYFSLDDPCEDVEVIT